MTLRASAIFIALAGTFLGGGTQAADGDAASARYRVSELSNMLRILRHAEDDVALGLPDAQKRRRQTLKAISECIVVTNMQTLISANGGDDVLALELSGAHIQMFGKALEKNNWSENNQTLGRAILTLRQGSYQEAKALLATVDHASLPTTARIPLALVEARISSDDGAEQALRHLQQARISVPGTGLEEAILRQEIIVLLKLGRVNQVGDVIATYLRRYPNSDYWGRYAPQLVRLILRTETFASDDIIKAAQSIHEQEGAKHYRRLLLMLSRGLAMKGQFAQATKLAAYVSDNEPGQSDMKRSAELYRRVSAINVGVGEDWLHELQDLDVRAYRPDEQKLIYAAIDVARDVIVGFEHTNGRSRDGVFTGVAKTPTDEQLASVSPLAGDLSNRVEAGLKEAQVSLGGLAK
ncbi:MAG: hypothetical protein R3D51_07840 [Hyphomicrobiaceae bacterium]